MKITTKFWIGIIILIVLSPLGLILSKHFKAGAAWGEWGAGDIHNLFGYIPKGFEKLSNLWHAPIQDYAFEATKERGLSQSSLDYIISAAIGIIIIVLVVLLIGRILARKGE